MASSSASGSAKRKRNNTTSGNGTVPISPTAELLQPSSRDASGEDAEDSAANVTISSKPKKLSDSTTSAAKRAKTKAIVTSENTATSNGSVAAADVDKEDPGEPSDTTEASTDIASRSKRKARNSFVRDLQDGSMEDGRAMPPPPKAGLQDPVGYHTNPPPVGRAVRIYADGVFDLFHLGHMRQLEQAKNAFPDVYLLVGVTGDAETHRRKGLTVLTGEERAETVRHCKWVDEVIPDCPWIVTREFLEAHRIDYVAHDDLPYGAAEGDDIYKPIKEQGKFLVTQRTEGVSTTGIITKIVRDYDKYIARQLKRGTSRQELNVSWLKKHELELKRYVADLGDTIRSNWSTTGQEVSKELRHFWQNSQAANPAIAMNRSDVDMSKGMRSKSTEPQGASQGGGGLRMESPGRRVSTEFTTGYMLGLVGGVRSWMTRSRTSFHDGYVGSADSEGDSSDSKLQGEEETARGRA